jgi:predicted  nucleic acid-binding Zn-ribbon protein
VSALTKVFVVLQVILAILLSAGIIVFVNRTEDNRGLYNDAKASLGQANRQVANLQATAKAIEQQFNSDLQNKNSDLAQTQARLQDLQTQLDSTKTSLASAQADLDKSTASNTFASQALKVALDQNGTLQSQYSDLQKALASMQKDNADNTMAIADLRSRLDATERERKFLAEQNQQLAEKQDEDNKLFKQYNINPNGTSPTATAINPEPNIALDGKIQDTRMIDGVPYATISIGSADQVTSGMQFKVIDQGSGTFLGYLKVDTVEPHAASGRLDGPHVTDVHAGNEARTQL